MSNSKVEDDFIKWCKYIHPDIDPYIFFSRHQRYYDEYFPFLEELMLNLHQEISNRLPNVNFSFKSRVKSKRSFLIKSFRTMSENIENLFPSEYPTDENELKVFQEKRSKYIKKFFKFLIKDKPPKIERYLKIKQFIENTPPEKDILDCFSDLFDQLNELEKKNLIIRLGRTEDTFANRIIVKDINFRIDSVQTNEDGQPQIIDSNGNVIPICSSVQIPIDTIVTDEKTRNNYVVINGEQQKISDMHLLYDNELSSSQRTFKNASKTPDNKITILRDSLVIDDHEYFNILSTYTDLETGDIMVVPHQYMEPREYKFYDNDTKHINLSKLIRDGINVQLTKFDSEYTKKALYDIRNTMYDYYDEIGITRIWTRSKDYVANPKKSSNYQSLHDSYFYEELGYSLETQIRDLEMERDCKNKSDSSSEEQPLATSHDSYKKAKMKTWLKNPILAHILAEDKTAFDSSTEILEKLLYNPKVSLPDLLGKYIITTKLKDKKISSFVPDIRIIFEHTFHDPSAYSPSSDSSPKLDFSNYKNFLKSLKTLNDFRSNGNYNIDLDDL